MRLHVGNTRPLNVFSLFLLVGLAGTQPAWANDLLTMYRNALSNDASYAAARSQYLATQEKLPQGRAGLLPTLNGLGSSAFTEARIHPRDNVTPNFTRQFNTNSVSLALSQPLFRFGNWETYQQSKLQVAQGELVLAQAQQDVAIRVTKAYFDVLNANDTIQVIEAKKGAISEQLEQAKRNFQVGTATVTDQQEAQARYDLAVAEEIAARNDLANKQSALQQIIGVAAPAKLTPLKSNITLPNPNPLEASKWIAAAEEQSYAVTIAQANVEIARRNVGIQQAGHLPTLDFNANVARNSQTASTITALGTITNQNVVGVSLVVPLFAGGATQSKVREAAALEQVAKDNLLAARRAAALTAQQAYNGVQSGLAQVRALEAAEKSSLLALDSNKLGYKVGVRINIDVLNAQQQVFTTRRDLQKARYDTLVNSLNLKAATASLKEEDLQELNSLLDASTR